MSSRQIDNSNLHLKKKIRKQVLSLIDKEKINVLNLYAGYNKAWDFETGKKLNFLNIDNECKKGRNLYGDNIKYLKNIGIDFFDIVDLDAYGHPWKILSHIRNTKDILIVYTFIQTYQDKNISEVLKNSGISTKMRQKCPSLFRGRHFLHQFLFENRVDKIYNIRLNQKKEYGYFLKKSCIGGIE